MRLAAAVFGIAIGIALGLTAGWVIWPVEYTDVTPEYMRAESQIDYAIMVATAYGADGDLETARERLGRLGNQSEIALLNAFLTAKNDPAALVALQQLAAELELHATLATPAE